MCVCVCVAIGRNVPGKKGEMMGGEGEKGRGKEGVHEFIV